MLTIYHNPKCSKSRCALDILKSTKEEITVVDYMKDPPSRKELTAILKMFRIPASGLIRTSETVWQERFKNTVMEEHQILDAMVENPQLIERPIIIRQNKAVIGRPPERIYEILGLDTFNNPL